MIFPALLFIFRVTFIMFKHVKVRQHIEYMVQKLSKNMVIVKFHPDMKSFQILFSFFFLSQGEISKTGMILLV